MGYKIDRVYDSDGIELTTAGGATSLAGAVNMEYDGRYMWVACSGGIAIYEWWGAASDNEPAWDTLDELVYPRYDSGAKKKLRLVTFIGTGFRATALEPMALAGATKYVKSDVLSVWVNNSGGAPSSPYWIKRCNDKMYVTNGATFASVCEFDIATQTFVRAIATTEVYTGISNELFTRGTTYSMKSNLGVSGGKLWFVGTSFGDNATQKIYSYNPITNVRNSTDIPVRPSVARTWITSGYNGGVYITNYNNVSISKFSDVNGDFISTIRMNAFPTHAFTGPDRRIWVSSFGGMVTLVDYDDDQAHNDYSSGVGDNMRAVSVASDPTNSAYLWFINSDGLLVRHNLNTHQQLETGSGNDWNMENAKIGSPEQLYITQQFTYQDADLVSHTVKPYAFLLQGGKLLAWKLERYLYREVYATVNGQAAVVEGPQMYFGEN